MLYRLFTNVGKFSLFFVLLFCMFLTLFIGLAFYLHEYRVIAALAWVGTLISGKGAASVLAFDMRSAKS